MNGISSTLKEEIKKSHDSKKKEKFKFIAAILTTNLMVAALFLSSQKDSLPEEKLLQKIIHPNHQMMVIPLDALVSDAAKNEKETVISVISRDKRIIVPKAYLHEEVKRNSEATHFKIEIPNSEVVRVSDFITEGVLAVPYVENKKSKALKRGSKYEVNL